MFKQKKDYLKKKYKDVPKLNIGDVNRILQQTQNEDHKFRIFTSILEIQNQYHERTQESNTEEILRENVNRVIELYGDADINQDALKNIYKDIDETQNIEEQINKKEFNNIFVGDSYNQQITIAKQIDKYEHQLNVLQTKISKNIFANYSIYLQALHNIDSISQTSQSLIIQVQDTRQRITNVKNIMLKKSQQILQKRQSILNLQTLIQNVQKIKETFYQPYELFVESMQNGYIDAQSYLQTILNIQMMDGIECIPINYKEQRIEYVRQITCKGLIDQYINFEEPIYQIHYNSYIYMQNNNIVQPFDQVIELLIMRAYEAKMQVVFDEISQILSIDFYFDNIIDSLNQIPKDELVEFYRELCCQTINFFTNFHFISRFHMQNNNEINIMELRHNIYEKITQKIIDIIEQTTSWPRMNKEDILCFFAILTIFTSKVSIFGGQELQEFKIFIENKFNIYLNQRGYDKQLKEILQNEDCKKCLKITLNQTFIILQIAQKQTTFQLFKYEDPFPDTLNIFKPIEFKKVIDLILGSNVSYKKQQNAQTLIYQGKERTLMLTYTVNQLLYMLQSYLLYIHYYKEKSEMLINELCFFIKYYIYIIVIHSISDECKKHIFDDTVSLAFDQKHEYEIYTQQFEQLSNNLIMREKYGNLIKFLKNIKLNEDNQIKKTQVFDLMDRIVFIESIIYILNEFKDICEIFIQFKSFYEELNNIFNQLQELILRSGVNVELINQLINYKYEIKTSDKEDQQRINLIDKIIQTQELKLFGLTNIQLQDVQKYYYDEILYQIILTYSKIKKVTNLGRETMLNDFQRIEKSFNIENQQYEQYIKIFNQIQIEPIIEFIHKNQKIFPYKVLLSLFNAQVLSTQKKQQKKDQFFQIFKNYQQ